MAGGGCTKSPVDDLKPSVGVFEASGVPKIIEVLGSGESVKIQIRPLSVQNTSVPESAFVSVVRHHLDGKRKVDRHKIEKKANTPRSWGRNILGCEELPLSTQ